MIYNLTLTLFILFSASTLISLVYIFAFYARLATFKGSSLVEAQKTEGTNHTTLPVSILICAQNELQNLRSLLPILLEQDYPEFEIIIVDDSSTDDTSFLLQDIVRANSKLHIIELTESVKNKQGKKFALMMGLKGARFNHVLLTDADCMPASNQWVRKMMDGFSDEKEIVLGYSPYYYKPGLLNLFIRYETFITATNYLSFALAKTPYMGVGRNLAYHKHLFFDNKGFSSHIHLMSGDDDLFINQVADSKNTNIVIDPQSFTFSHPKMNFSDYFIQKSRHLSVGKYYKPTHQFLLSLSPVASLLLYISFTLLIVLKTFWLFTLGIFGVYLLSLWIVFYLNASKLKDPMLGFLSPILHIFYNLYLLIMNFMGLFYKAKTWK